MRKMPNPERLEAAGAALKKLSPTRRQAKIGDVMVGTFVVTSIGTWCKPRAFPLPHDAARF